MATSSDAASIAIARSCFMEIREGEKSRDCDVYFDFGRSASVGLGEGWTNVTPVTLAPES